MSSLTDHRTVVMTTVRHEISQLNSELDVLKKFYSEINTECSSYKKTSRRSKRSLFGFVAPLLTSIFGVANEDQLQNTKVNLNTLKRKTNNIGIALGQTLISLYDTRVEVSRNREYLNKVSLSVRMTRRILNNALTELRDQLSVQNQLEHFIVRIHSLFHMATLSLHRIGFNLQVLRMIYMKHGKVTLARPYLVLNNLNLYYNMSIDRLETDIRYHFQCDVSLNITVLFLLLWYWIIMWYIWLWLFH